MFLKLPQNSEKLSWTWHSKAKMRQYQLSEKRVLRVLRHPDRKEEGIALGTIAVMQVYGTKKYPKEIWVMYQITKKKIENRKQKIENGGRIRIISAWRYPARSPIGKMPPIPEDTLEELDKILKEN